MGQCYKKTYTTSEVIFRSALVCWGGFGQPTCEHLPACVGQYREQMKTRQFNLLIKKARRMAGLKS